MENPPAALQESCLGFQEVVQVRIYIMNRGDRTTVHGIYGSYFTGPAQSTIQGAGLPKGAFVEIAMMAQKR
jgi:enamine deaminase RidA (YjgF/YER057c/UK114 family)